MIEEGYVHDVRLVTLGGFVNGAHLTGSTTLNVFDASDFNEEGGSLTIDGVVFAYTSADLETDTIELATPIAADMEDGDPIEVSPTSVEKQAVVVIDGFDEALTAVIPHSLYGSIPDGIREDFNRESVTVEERNGTWYVTDVYGIAQVIDGQYLENVVADDILDGIVTEVKLANDAVTQAKIAANAVGSNELINAAVEAAKIADNAVIASKILSGEIGANHLAAGSVTAGKIAASSIQAGSFAAGSIATNDLAANAVTAAKIAALTITGNEIAANAITASKILAGTITADRLDVNALIGKTAQSTNFVNDPEQGITGWQFNADGSAYLRSAVIGNDLYEINETGNARFQSMTANQMFLNGEDVEALIASCAQGVLNVYPLEGNLTYSAADTEYLVTRFTIPAVQARMYEVFIDNVRFDRGSGTTPTQFQVNVYSKFGGSATNSDSLIHQFWRGAGYSSAATDDIWSSGHVFSPPDANLGQDMSIAIYASVNSVSSTPRLQTTSNTRVVVKDLGGKVTYAPAVDITSGVVAKSTYTKTYNSSWMSTWGVNSGRRTDGNAYQGNYSATNGNNYTKYGFSSAIATDLSGATVKKVELYLDNNHSYSNSGLDAVIGTHANSTQPTGSSSTSGTFDRQRIAFTKGQAKWVTLSSGFGTDLKSGSALGITLGGPSVGTQALYGYFASSAKLRITYEK